MANWSGGGEDSDAEPHGVESLSLPPPPPEAEAEGRWKDMGADMLEDYSHSSCSLLLYSQCMTLF